MHRLVAYRVDLHVAGQGAVGAGITQVDVEQAGQETRLVHLGHQPLGFDGNADGGLLAAVDDAGNAAGAARRTGGPLSGPVAHQGAEIADLGH